MDSDYFQIEVIRAYPCACGNAECVEHLKLIRSPQFGEVALDILSDGHLTRVWLSPDSRAQLRDDLCALLND